MSKLSRYNKLFIAPKGRYAYSGLKGTLARITDNLTWSYLSGTDVSISNLEQLEEAGFIVPDDTDECALILSRLNNVTDTDPLSLQIAPTLSCNFGCKGCIQGKTHNGEAMRVEVQNAVVEFAEGFKRPLWINWYGGEPLLGLNAIRNISKGLSDYAASSGLAIRSSMTTNGYLVSDELAFTLTQEIGIQEFQITLDGPEQVHNSRRCLSDGSPTFQRILSGIKSLYEYGALIKVRINVDKSNWDSVSDLLDILIDNDLSEVHLTAGMMHGCADNCSLMTTREFSDTFVRFQGLLYEKGFPSAANAHLPHPLKNSCMMSYPYAFLIDPEGRLFKCLDHINDSSHAIGNVVSWSSPAGSFIKYPSQQSKCSNCDALPFCMGGCPLHHDETFQGCNVWRSATEAVMRAYIANNG